MICESNNITFITGTYRMRYNIASFINTIWVKDYEDLHNYKRDI